MAVLRQGRVPAEEDRADTYVGDASIPHRNTPSTSGGGRFSRSKRCGSLSCGGEASYDRSIRFHENSQSNSPPDFLLFRFPASERFRRHAPS